MQENPLHMYLAIAERWLASSSTFINFAREKTVEKEQYINKDHSEVHNQP